MKTSPHIYSTWHRQEKIARCGDVWPSLFHIKSTISLTPVNIFAKNKRCPMRWRLRLAWLRFFVISLWYTIIHTLLIFVPFRMQRGRRWKGWTQYIFSHPYIMRMSPYTYTFVPYVKNASSYIVSTVCFLHKIIHGHLSSSNSRARWR